MQKQKQAGTGDPFGSEQEAEQLSVKPLSVQIPDAHETMKLAGVKDVKLSSDQSRQAGGKELIVICFCGKRQCGIGPMTLVVEK